MTQEQEQGRSTAKTVDHWRYVLAFAIPLGEFPAEWYDHIPEGFEIVTINGAMKPFERGVTDDDRRFGLLAFGIVVKA
jgi:hypothetical protein